MIDKEEKDSKASQFEIHPSHVQRDYVYGWVVTGIYADSPLKDVLFLKGGNTFRKG